MLQVPSGWHLQHPYPSDFLPTSFCSLFFLARSGISFRDTTWHQMHQHAAGREQEYLVLVLRKKYARPKRADAKNQQRLCREEMENWEQKWEKPRFWDVQEMKWDVKWGDETGLSACTCQQEHSHESQEGASTSLGSSHTLLSQRSLQGVCKVSLQGQRSLEAVWKSKSFEKTHNFITFHHDVIFVIVVCSIFRLSLKHGHSCFHALSPKHQVLTSLTLGDV